MLDEVIEFEGEDEDALILEMKTREKEMGTLLVKKTIWALENNKDEFIYAIHSKDDFIMAIKRNNFLDALEHNLDKMESYEEYELCKKSLEWIDYLKIEEKTNVNKR